MKIESIVYRFGNGTSADMIRLRADDGKALTIDGQSFYGSIDVESADGWHEVPDREQVDDELTAEEALDIIIGCGT